MRKSLNGRNTAKLSGIQTRLSAPNTVYAGIAWSVLSLLFFLLFSVSVPGQERPFWYMVVTYILENGAWLFAAILCVRNWRSPQIVSGSKVWLGFGIGLSSYFVGNLLMAWWEVVWGLNPAVSLGDLFFVTTYVALVWAMILAVIPRRLNLERKHWQIVAAIAAAGTVLAVCLLAAPPASPPPVSEDSTPASAVATSQLVSPKEPLSATGKPSPASPALTPAVSKKSPAPDWLVSLENKLLPLAEPLGYLYIVGDILLLTIAATLLLAFWDGRFAQSWRMIAAAAFCFYIADMWFRYATDHISNYQSGFLIEVFWVFSAVFFAIGAALEFDISNRTRPGGRKKASGKQLSFRKR